MYLERIQRRIEEQLPSIAFLPFTTEYVDNYTQWFNDPFVRRHLHPNTARTPEEIQRWMTQLPVKTKLTE